MATVFCPCYRCRPTGMSFKDAMRESNRIGMIRAYGVEGARQREQQKKDRLEALRKAGDQHNDVSEDTDATE